MRQRYMVSTTTQLRRLATALPPGALAAARPCSENVLGCLQPLRRISNSCHKRPQSKNLVKMLGSNCIQEGQGGWPHSLALRISVCIGHDQLHNHGNNGGQ